MTDSDTPSNVVQLRPTSEPEQIVLDGELVDDDPFQTLTPDVPLARPPWLGVSRASRRIWGRQARRAARKTLRGLRKLPRLTIGLPLRWFFLGIKGWPRFLRWALAVDAHMSVGEAVQVKKGRRHLEITRTWKQAWLATTINSGTLWVPLLWWLTYRYGDLPNPWLQWLAPAPHIVATAIYGGMHDTKPPSSHVAVRARGEADPTAMTLILRDVGLLRKPDKQGEGGEAVTYSSIPVPEGDNGFVHSYELPKTCGKHAGHVKAKRDEIAAALGVDPDWVDITGKGHRFQIWIAEDDPFADPTESPLLYQPEWCVFDPIPVGRTVRGREVRMPIVGTHFLSAGLPNVGKSSFARALTAGPILDPHCDIHVFDLKGGKDWKPLERIAKTFHNGPVPDQTRALKKWLAWSEEETTTRGALLASLPDDEAPEGKITRRLHQTDRMRFQWLVIDEAHRAFEDPDLLDALIRYVKERRFVGYGLCLITQTVEGKLAERFTGLRSAVGSRIALRLMDWVSSNQILGDQMNTKGWNAGDLPPVMGLSIVRADMDADGQADKGAGKVRSHYINLPDLTELCKVGEYLRGLADQEGNPLPQVETADEELSTGQLLDRIHTHAPDTLPTNVTDATTLGEWLASKGLPARKTRGVMCRSRASVEASMGLPAGSLADTTPEVQGPAPDPSQDPTRDPTRQEDA